MGGSWGQLNGLDIKKMCPFKHLAILAIIALTSCAALPASDEKQGKIGIFNVVRFPNDVCKGSGSLNGTCYTKEECSNRKGTASGECANGFGVCCVISLTCGGSSSDNCTNLVQAATTSPTTDCQYKICPVSSSVNRIRLDLSVSNFLNYIFKHALKKDF